MKSIANQAKSFGWVNILNINDSNGITRSLLNDYRQLTTAEVKMHARNQWMNQHTRDAQNAVMLYHFLFESLDKSFKATILLKNHNYQVTVGNYTTEDGPCLLKQIIVSTYIDTRATAAQIRESLVDMAQQLETQKGNITKFNEWVEEQVTILQSRGEEAHDLLTYLWKTYQKALDAKFVEYIQNLSNDFITGKSDFTAQELMNLADTMYKARVQMNEWALLSTEQEEIVALNPYKIVGKKKYYWCLHHNDKQGQWVQHQPDECCNKTNKEEAKEESEQANLAASFDTEYSEDKEE